MSQGFFQYSNTIVNELLKFASSSDDMFFLFGKNGSLKSETIEKIITELGEDNLIFRHFCFRNSLINDFLLNFYDKLKDFSLSNKIILKKFLTGDFKEKVSHYFKTIEKNCIIVIENFEQIEQNTSIISFLCHLASYSNVKIIISSDNEQSNIFSFKDIKTRSFKIPPATKEDFKAKIADLIQETDEELQERFYDITSGLELYLNMTIKYCLNTGANLYELVNEFERKNETFEKFIVSKFISITPRNYLEFHKILCLLTNPVSSEFIQQYGIGRVDYLDYLIKNYLVSKFDKEVYVKDYFKKYVIESFSVQEKITSYRKLINCFENEITKSPKDRLLRLSRESIRKEIECFEKSIPTVSSTSLNIPFLMNFTQQETKSPLAEKLQKIQDKKNQLAKKEKPVSAPQKAKETFFNKDRNSIIELINNSREFNKQYMYKEAVDCLLKALEMDKQSEFKIEICILAAKNYIALNEYENAQDYYNQALQNAIAAKDSRKCEIQYLIAQMNKLSFNIEDAKEQYKLIASDESNPDKYRAIASIELGELEQSNSDTENAIKHYNNALALTLGKDKKITSKAYFRLALLYDENQNIEKAIEYYKKNYLTSSLKNENEYYSLSLGNLALIYSENAKYKEAIECLKLALAFDSENDDYENMYYSQKELAKIYMNIDEKTALNYYNQALYSANKLNDTFKVALVHFEKGEFYYDKIDDIKALECFLSAKKALTNNDKENLERINLRIQDIKMRLDSSTFNLIVGKYD